MDGIGAEPKLDADHDSDFKSVASSGASNSDLDYTKSIKKTLSSSENRTDLEAKIHKLK